MLLDEVMPRWDRREVHRIAADLPAEDLLEAVEVLTWDDVALFKALMALRFGGKAALAPDAPVLDWFIAAGFRPMGRTRNEMLFVATQSLSLRRRAETPVSVDAFEQYAEPGFLKLAISFAALDGSLVTETRVLATNAGARRLFAVYWFAIRAGSGLIRRVWLRAIVSRARSSVAKRASAAVGR